MKHVLTTEELSKISDDAFRAELRQKLSADLEASGDESAEVVDEDGNVWDMVSHPSSGDFVSDTSVETTEVQFSEEELAVQRAEAAALAAEAERFKEVVRPEVIGLLREEVRQEFRDRLRDKTNEVLRLRGELGALKVSDRREAALLSSTLEPLNRKIADLTRENGKLRESNDKWAERYEADTAKLKEANQELMNRLTTPETVEEGADHQ